MILSIPFSGFYESIHDSQIDNALWHGVFTDYETGWDNNDNLSNRAYDSIDWHELILEYARDYTDFFAHEFNLKIEFESLSSPKYYNFETDRIFCTIPESEVIRLFDETSKITLMNTAQDMFTSRDGFISFYEPDWIQWGDVLTWDCNQLHCLLMAWLSDNNNFDDGDNDYEWCYIENANANGFFYELIHKHCPDKRLFKIHDYLNERAKRIAA